MDAIIEGYNVLRALGYEILPQGEYESCINKKNYVLLYIVLCFLIL